MTHRAGDAFLLATRSLADQGYVATLFSREHGLLRGLIRKADGLCAADVVRYTHTRRLEGQLGRLTLECAVSRAAQMFTCPVAPLLAGYVAEVCHHTLPEDHAYPALYDALHNLWHSPAPWWQRVAAWERVLLANVGYGLSLDADPVPCPVGERLAYVSPNSGRAVSLHVGAGYAQRLLPLPALWGGPEVDEPYEARNALTLTGHFLTRAAHGKDLASRARLVDAILPRHCAQPKESDSDATPTMPDSPWVAASLRTAGHG